MKNGGAENQILNMKKIFTLLAVCFALTHNLHAAWFQWTVGAGGNDHYYQAINVPAGITWFDAKTQAESLGGYLATITSAGENTFVHALINSSPFWVNVGVDSRGPWLGGYQPEGSLEPAGGWTWVTGEAFVYQNWGISASSDGQQPKNNPVGENYLHYFGSGNNNFADTWNDLLPNGGPRGFIVEAVPEPGSAALMSLAAVTWMLRRRKA